MDREKYENLSDEELVVSFRGGDEGAFEELVRRYQNKALSVAFGILGNRDDALDVVQDAFIKAYRSLGDFQFGSRFYTWFYRIVVNESIDKVRKASRNPGMSLDETWMRADENEVVGNSLRARRPDEMVERVELGRMIGRAIDSLPEHHRVVIILREVEGLSYDEIASILGISIGTVMSRLHYAREKLREILGDYVRD